MGWPVEKGLPMTLKERLANERAKKLAHKTARVERLNAEVEAGRAARIREDIPDWLELGLHVPDHFYVIAGIKKVA